MTAAKGGRCEAVATGTLVALLRGVNVGRARRLSMAELRAVVGELGYLEVRTVLASGNIVLSDCGRGPLAAGQEIEEALSARLGVSSRVTVVTAAELVEIVEGVPALPEADNPSRLLVAFPASAAILALLAPLAAADWHPERLVLTPRAAYLWCPEGVIASRLVKEVERIAGDGVTTRTWSTVLKLHAAASGNAAALSPCRDRGD